MCLDILEYLCEPFFAALLRSKLVNYSFFLKSIIHHGVSAEREGSILGYTWKYPLALFESLLFIRLHFQCYTILFLLSMKSIR